MTRGRPSKYLHLLRSMQEGDVIYLPEEKPRLDRQLVSLALSYGGRIKAACFLATKLNPSSSHRVVRITLERPLTGKPNQ